MSRERVGFATLMDLETLATSHFRTPGRDGYPAGRLFGGQLLAQALMAAGRTLPVSAAPNSLHAYFLAPASPLEPLDYVVTSAKDGRTFSHREVNARQRDRTVFRMICSFAMTGSGDTSWNGLPAVAGEPGLGSLDAALGGSPLATFPATDVFEIRFPHESIAQPRPFHPCWIRLIEDIGPDPLLNACAIAFVSDMGVLSGAVPAEDVEIAYGGASLDHAMWFGPLRPMDGWYRVDVSPLMTVGHRGLASGAIRDSQGTVVAALAQEGYFGMAATSGQRLGTSTGING